MVANKMIASNHLYMLSNRNTNYGMIINNTSYVIGFPNYNMANYMKKHINVEKPICFNPIERGTTAQIYLSPILIPIVKTQDKAIFKVKKGSTNEFMEIPSYNNIGIIYIMDLSDKSKSYIEFNSLIIDPLNDLISYRAHLNMMVYK